MQQHLILSIVLLAFQAFATSYSLAQEVPETGEIVLHAIDADTKQPISGVVFFKSNSLAEDWFVELGSTNAEGKLSIQSVPIPGYYFSIWRMPTGYKVASLDDVPSNVVVGRTVHHRFHLRRRPAEDAFPKLRDVPKGKPSRIPVPVPLDKSVYLESVVERMPGFADRRVKFRFYPNENAEATPEQLLLAERIFHNGSRVYAAVKDELTCFQNADGQDKGQIENMKEILIEIHGPRTWMFWCRLPHGMRLKQHGYRITFDDLNRWDLQIPDYLQPGF